MSFATAFLQTPTQLFGANTSGRRNLLDLGLSTLTVSDKAILNCLAINTDKLKCVDVLEMTGTAVFGGNVIFNGPVVFNGPVAFLDGAVTICDIDCPTNFTLTAGVVDDPSAILIDSRGSIRLDADDSAGTSANGLLAVQSNALNFAVFHTGATSPSTDDELVLGLQSATGQDFVISHYDGSSTTVDLVISQPNTGAGNALVLQSAGTGQSAITMTAAAGGLNARMGLNSIVDVSGVGQTLILNTADATSAATQTIVSSAGTGVATAAGGGAVALNTATGGISVTSATNYFISGLTDSTVQAVGTGDLNILGGLGGTGGLNLTAGGVLAGQGRSMTLDAASGGVAITATTTILIGNAPATQIGFNGAAGVAQQTLNAAIAAAPAAYNQAYTVTVEAQLNLIRNALNTLGLTV